MIVIYLLSYIDRANIGNAKIEGMDKYLGLTGNLYNIATTIFFVPYIIFITSCVLALPNKRLLTVPYRDSFQHGPQTRSTEHLAIHLDPFMGHSDDMHGRRQRLQRPCRMPFHPWTL